MEEPVQMRFSFDVGGTEPNVASLKVSGPLNVERDLKKGEEIHVRVVDADGQIIADGYGNVVAVAFKDHRDKDGILVDTERIHTAKLDK